VAAPVCGEPESPSNSRLNPKSTRPDEGLLPEGEDSGAGAPVGTSGARVGPAAPDGVRADTGIGGGVTPTRPETDPAAPAPLAVRDVEGGLGGPAGGRLETAGVPADPPKSSDSPEGGGPEVETGAGEESRSKLSGGPPPVAWAAASDKSSAKPSGGVLLELLSEPGSHPGRAQLFDCGRSSGRGTLSRDTGKSSGRGTLSRDTGRSPRRGIASRDTGKSSGRGTASRDTGKSSGRGTASRDTGRLSVNRLAGGLTLKIAPQWTQTWSMPPAGISPPTS
jgi:hypothetical protein